MEKNIQKQLEIIEKSNAWIHSSLEGNRQKDAYRNMVNFRRKLNKKKFALEGNPAVAMFGESQAGKSYLVSSLLSQTGRPFEIIDGTGSKYNFKDKINPHGNEHESTSVVTRFSTKYKWINADYPIIVKLLSPTDIILVLCEAYYNNLQTKYSLSFDDINNKINEYEATYTGKTNLQQWISEDDILDIEEYFRQNFSNNTFQNIVDARFFEKISLIISKINPDEWEKVFSLLWNFNTQLTKLFADLIRQYKTLNFADTIYLPIDAVLREKGTLLEVDRLDELYSAYSGPNKNYSATSKILFIYNNTENTITFSKSYLCALTSELIFCLQEDTICEKPFLEKTDLLDFPGTRRPESTEEDDISDKSLTQLLRRGRVDYLFNKYSYSEKINVLMFCQNHKDSKQSVMPAKINKWIGNMIGKTAKERENFNCPIPPLFVISTWFNCDMQFDNSYNPSNKSLLLQKWNDRFEKVLENQIFKTDTYSWFNEWTISESNFRNIFLLRDFEKSADTGQNCSQLFKGYIEQKEEKEEITTPAYPNFRQDLRESFIGYDFVKRHFENPAKSWDEAANMNKDGTKLIIDKLTIAANNINAARREKTLAELNEISQTILAELLKHFHSNDKDEELRKAKDTAGDIQTTLAMAFAADKIKNFGLMMKEFMLDEGAVLELFRKIVDDIEHRDVKNMDIYSILREEVPVEEGDTVETYFERLCVRYEKTTEERKAEYRARLEADQIDLEELIKGNSDLIKNNAQQLAEALLEYWSEYITLNDKTFIQQILGQDDSLENIKEMYQKLFKKLGIAKRIAEKIRRYVDGHSKTDLSYGVAADISAELLNKCISTVGFEYLDEAAINDLKEANEKNNLGLILENNTNPTETSLAELFIKVENQTKIMTEQPEAMKSLPNRRNRSAWSNRLKVGFVSVCDIPNYDLAANANLGKIIDECKNIKY